MASSSCPMPAPVSAEIARPRDSHGRWHRPPSAPPRFAMGLAGRQGPFVDDEELRIWAAHLRQHFEGHARVLGVEGEEASTTSSTSAAR